MSRQRRWFGGGLFLGGLAVIVVAAVGVLVGHRSLDRAENDGTILINLTAREQVAVVRYVRDVLAMSAGVESATADLTEDLLATTAALRDGGVVEGFQGSTHETVAVAPPANDRVRRKVRNMSLLVEQLVATGDAVLATEISDPEYSALVHELRVLDAQLGSVTKDLSGELILDAQRTRQRIVEIQEALALLLLVVLVASAVMKVRGSRRAVERAESRFDDVFESAPVGAAEVDTKGRIVRANSAFSRLVGGTTRETSGALLFSFIHSEDRDWHKQRLDEIVAGQREASQDEVRYTAVDGTVRWVQESISREQGDGTAILVHAQDLSRVKHAHELLEFSALHDSLTGLANRSLLADRAKQLLANRDVGTVAALFVDLDHFKDVNDTLGHSVGDHVLQEIARRLSHICRDADTVARFGGDEFVVLAAGLDSPDAAIEFAERIHHTVVQPMRIDGRRVQIAASIGLTISSGDDDAESLVRDADLAMYAAKEAGRDRLTVFDRQMRDDLVGRVKLEAELRAGLERDELELHYQPVFAGSNELHLVGVEALVRWNHPTEGQLMPGAFLPLAESSGLMATIDEWVVRQALAQLQEWSSREDRLADAQLMVNAAPLNFGDPSFPDRIASAVLKAQIAPDRLVLELVESAVLEQPAIAHQVIAALRSRHVQVVLDDFGTGYSSLSHLTDLDIDGLKVDRTFVTGVASDPQRLAIVESVLAMTNALNLSVVAEGIEDHADLETLRVHRTMMLQGYGLCRPLPVDELEAFVSAGGGQPAAHQADLAGGGDGGGYGI